MPLLTPDTAWRQWKRARQEWLTLKAREDADPLKDGHKRDTDKAAANMKQASATWLQTMLEHFERRRLDAVESGRPAASDKELKALGLPCIDCLKVSTEGSTAHKVRRDESKLYPVWATCGGSGIDPIVDPMPVW
jgi:hypothetical protein